MSYQQHFYCNHTPRTMYRTVYVQGRGCYSPRLYCNYIGISFLTPLRQPQSQAKNFLLKSWVPITQVSKKNIVWKKMRMIIAMIQWIPEWMPVLSMIDSQILATILIPSNYTIDWPYHTPDGALHAQHRRVKLATRTPFHHSVVK